MCTKTDREKVELIEPVKMLPHVEKVNTRKPHTLRDMSQMIVEIEQDRTPDLLYTQEVLRALQVPQQACLRLWALMRLPPSNSGHNPSAHGGARGRGRGCAGQSDRGSSESCWVV